MSTFTTVITSYLTKISRPYHITAALIFLVVGLLLYWPYLGMMPEGAHVWPQTDRLSLAINFYDFGFDFWHPRTSSFESIGGITGVEFPIQPYIASLGGLVFGRQNILTVFRLLDGLMALLGFWYLFRIVFERTGSFVAGLVPGTFLLTAPTYLFYALSTLPDPFSFSLTFIAFYYWLQYFDASDNFRDLLRAFAILILASLIKTTCTLHLGAVAGITVLYALFEPARFTQRQRIQLLSILGLGVALLAGFYVHNAHLNAEYQSQQFLAKPMPPDGVETWHEYLRVFRETWRYEYITRVEYDVLFVCVLICLAGAYKSWQQFPRVIMLLLASLAIAPLFYQLMGAQLAVHDYYIICSFLPPMIICLILALLLITTTLRKRKWIHIGITVGLLLLSGSFIYTSFGQLAGRMSDYHPPASVGYTHRWMRGGAALLKRAGVPHEAHVLVLGDYSPNMALTFFDRRGRIMATYLPDTKLAAIVEYASAFGLEYVIMKTESYALLAQEHTALLEAFEPVIEQPVVVLRVRHPEKIAW
ncbi:hypothetical protein [Hymenobacter defluvii]|uniref:Glycosyltransferase RgtA/B/C/D-like domain-containing protein n=1 Tax=Hymenobacter defluvii TaxID=2054411 RepID=A0ABS3TE22_9BACT|nr:hypothetical protein [Hymenobacter defluvii]MBO3271900.1 hypothetical protein [Hymenobacter defluvii]